MDLMWHPVRPIVASVSTSGVVYIWATNYTENWSAFAPDFTELQENVDYIEREDEFDIIDEDENEVKKKQGEETEDVDVVTVDKIAAYSSEEEDELWFIPTAPERDTPSMPTHAFALHPPALTLPEPVKEVKLQMKDKQKEPKAKKVKLEQDKEEIL